MVRHGAAAKLVAAAFLLLPFPGTGGGSAAAACSHVLPPAAALIGAKRPVRAQDLIGLRDIGFPDAALGGPNPLSLSPDKRRLAFILSRADPSSNTYCQGLVVIELKNGHAWLADEWQGFLPLSSFVRGLKVSVGLPRPNPPAWSPDGSSLAYLEQLSGRTQVVIARAGGGGSRIALRSAVDVEFLSWPRREAILFGARSASLEAEARIEQEGRSGWLYDRRFAPHQAASPSVMENEAPVQILALNPRSGAVRTASAGEQGLLGPFARSPTGWTARFRKEGEGLIGSSRLTTSSPTGAATECAAATCGGSLVGPWWDGQGKEVLFARREGWNLERTSFYRWAPGTGAPVLNFSTLEAVQNCVAAARDLICTSESATAPRHIVRIDSRRGKITRLFDPNPEFRSIALPSVTRLRWKNANGLEAWGDLVLPSHAAGARLPLIVTLYQSRGFLRGGTGDEFPIFLLAARGFAVLSIERPKAVAATIPGLRSEIELNAANERNWAERKSLHSAILGGLDLAIATGAVDPERVGITGLSDGATAVRFALINSARFAAASIGSCCIEPWTAMTYGGIAFADFNKAIGFPPASEENPAFWQQMSLARNAASMKTPLLMQLSDDEYLLALEAFTALREHGGPVELYVFPREHHVKWQPAHRLSVYERNLDWFSFWLLCQRSGDPAKEEQFSRWEAMRTGAPAAARLCPRLHD